MFGFVNGVYIVIGQLLMGLSPEFEKEHKRFSTPLVILCARSVQCGDIFSLFVVIK